MVSVLLFWASLLGLVAEEPNYVVVEFIEFKNEVCSFWVNDIPVFVDIKIGDENGNMRSANTVVINVGSRSTAIEQLIFYGKSTAFLLAVPEESPLYLTLDIQDSNGDLSQRTTLEVDPRMGGFIYLARSDRGVDVLQHREFTTAWE